MAALRGFSLSAYLAVAACAHRSPVAGVAEVRASVRPNDKNAIGALVDVVAPGAREAWVEHGDSPTYGERTTASAVPAGGKVVIPVIGLSATTPTHLRVHASFPDGKAAATGDLEFGARRLPPGVPESVRVTTSTPGLSGYVLVGLFDPAAQRFVATMIDRSGKIRWYWVAPPPGLGAAQFDRVRGHFLVVDGSIDAFYELDLASETVKTWKDTSAPDGLDGHDFVLMPNGNAMMIGWEFRKADTRPFFKRGSADAVRSDHTIDEIDPHGKAVFHWSSYGHIGLDEVIDGPTIDPANVQVVHANAVLPLPDGNLLASFRSTSSIVKIDRSSGAIVWRLGGKKSDFSFSGDPNGGFSRQHDPHFVGGELMMFDNGNQHTPRVSRVVKYRLDESARTATMTWQFHHDPELFSDVAGSARALPNGDVLVGWSSGTITEVDGQNRVVWEAKTEPFQVYRAIFVPSLYPETALRGP